MKATMTSNAATREQAMKDFNSRVPLSMLKNLDVWYSYGDKCWKLIGEQK
jgi:hypothetical protein